MGAATRLLRRLAEGGRETWRLDNGLLRADVLPGFGGRVWSLEDLERKSEWIWRNPKTPLAVPSAGAAYDDCWAGGWEELFPNDAKGRFDGRDLPDHGEWWSRAWKADVLEDTAERAAVRLRLETRSVPASCEKIVSLDAGAKSLRIRYRIENRGGEPLRHMLKQHLAAAVRPGDKLELPGGTVQRVDPGFSTLVKASGVAWAADFVLPQAGRDKEFVYVADLPEGWARVRRPDGSALTMSFDRKVFPHCWFFMDFGGWRGLYTVVVEPCTQWPKDMEAAAAAGRCAELPPGGVLETAVEVSLS